MAYKMITLTDPQKSDYFYAEAIKTLRTNIQFSGMNYKTILLTSCYSGEGKSDIGFHLAVEMGKAGKKVLLIDADIRKSTFASRYRIGRPVKGLSHYLCGTKEAEEICYQTNFENMDIIFAGSLVPNPSELLEEPALEELIHNLR